MHVTTARATLVLAAAAALPAAPAFAGDLFYADKGEFLGSAGTLTTEDFEDEPTIGNPSQGAQSSIAFDDFTAASAPPSLKVLDVPAFGNHNTTPGGVKYLSADTDASLDADVTFTFSRPIDRFGLFVVDAEQGVDIHVRGIIYNVPPGKNLSSQYFGIISDTPFTEVFLDVLNGDSHVSFDDVAYTAQGECFIVLSEEVTCHEPGLPGSFTYEVRGMDACSGGESTYTLTASGGLPGADLCFTLLIHDDQGGLCCTVERCVTIPECAPPPLSADLDRDGAVSIADLLMLLARWGPCADPDQCEGDLDGDGTVGPPDLVMILAGWG